jgi:hypothetical protein
MFGWRMFKSRLLATLAVLGTWGASKALADETFDYMSKPFTSNDNPALFGNYVTASVTLSCAGTCADGTYSFSIPPGSPANTFALSGDPTGSLAITLSLTTSGATFSGSNEYVILTGGAITSWSLDLYDYSGPIIERLYTFGSDAAIGTTDGSFYQNDPYFVQAYNRDMPGIWTEVSAAPGPIPGAGLLSYVALGLLGLGRWDGNGSGRGLRKAGQ